jgi:dTDP-3,4-didehydro-2,6-dideoxy-alpha-D-glucose 3-reductase
MDIMMSILILGYSKIAQKRIIPAFQSMEEIESIDIASVKTYKEAEKDNLKNGTIFQAYEEALNSSKAEIVYVSLINRDHAIWAKEAIKNGYHVIVDKPVATNLEDVIELIELANNKHRLFAEANVFSYHPQIKMVMDSIRKSNSTPKHITALFSFPPLEEKNFRYKKEYGGGALLDLGPYAISSGITFFGEQPIEVFSTINRTGGLEGVETSFSILANYSQGRTMVGHFGFDTEYVNCISVLGDNICVDIDRVFTIPKEYENKIIVRSKNKSRELIAPKSDCFVNFFNYILKSIKSDSISKINSQTLVSAVSLDRLIKSAQGGEDEY